MENAHGWQYKTDSLFLNLGIVVSHPSDKNKGVARVGHPNSVAAD